jgi:hypothetical protein
MFYGGAEIVPIFEKNLPKFERVIRIWGQIKYFLKLIVIGRVVWTPYN